MTVLVVVDDVKDWPLQIPGVQLVAANAYLTEPSFSEVPVAKVFNLCRSYRYQSAGYYVSLLAAARGHRPLPGVGTILDLQSRIIIRALSEDLNAQIQKDLAPIRGDTFTLSIYFGRNLAKRYDQLSLQLFNLFQSPLLRARFVREKSWRLASVRPISAAEVSPEHHDFVVKVAQEYFAGRGRRPQRRRSARYDMAILYGPEEHEAPSDAKARQRFAAAGTSLGLAVEFITRDDFARLKEFDALFIRETTQVDHHTYRFARRAAAEGLVVIDDPDSILKCTNKVYLAELLEHHRVPVPKTLVVHRGNVADIAPKLGLPCVLKQPDSSFSMGVVKVENDVALRREVKQLLDISALIIAQEYLPTQFDWRVGILDRRPLFICKYYMARQHWQIIKRDAVGRKRDVGSFETLPLEAAPRTVIRTALKAANLIGDGLYGVDVKQIGSQCRVIEVNDNPNIDAGVEDAVLGDALYRQVMDVFLRRIEARGRAQVRP